MVKINRKPAACRAEVNEGGRNALTLIALIRANWRNSCQTRFFVCFVVKISVIREIRG
jgi:hypothetical protein